MKQEVLPYTQVVTSWRCGSCGRTNFLRVNYVQEDDIVTCSGNDCLARFKVA